MSFGAVKHYREYYYKHPLTRAKSHIAPIETHKVYPVLNAEQLLKQRGRRRIVDLVRTQCGAPIEYYNALYQTLIDNCAEFLQNLPMLRNNRICRLDRQLHVASHALSLREPYRLAGELFNRTTDQEKALWNYVVFSSMLLGKLGEIVLQYQVALCDEKGVFERVWEPFNGKMGDQGNYYKIRSMIEKHSTAESHMNATLAISLMPKDGFSWIASHPQALEQWLLGLDINHDDGSGSLVATLYAMLEAWLIKQHKEQLLLEEAELEAYLEQLLEEYLLRYYQEHEFVNLAEEPEETLQGERFYQWLRTGIQEERLSVNQVDSDIFMTQEGVLLLHPELFDKFEKESPFPVNRDDVFNQFAKLGIIRNSNLENYTSKFPGFKEKELKGVILKDAQALFQNKALPPVNPYVVRAIFEKRAVERRVGQSVINSTRTAEAQDKAHQSDLDKKEDMNQQFPELRFSEKSSYKTFTTRNTPPRK